MNRKKLIVWGIVFSALAFFIAAPRVEAANQVVTDCSSDADLRAKLTTMQSGGGGTLTFNCGTATIHLTSILPAITTNTVVDGGSKIILSGDNNNQIFYVGSTGTLTVQYIDLTNGSSAVDGGAIYSDGWLILKHTTIEHSAAAASGGAIVAYGQVDIDNSVLAYNKALNAGALYPRHQSQVSITNSVLHDNQATGTGSNGIGGAILLWDGPGVGIINSDLYNNTARAGGAIHNAFANSGISLQDSKVRDNKATANGGGIYSEGGALTMNNVTVSGNTASNVAGGLMYYGGNSASIVKTTFSGNSAVSAGGGMDIDIAIGVSLVNVTFSNNSAAYGGAVQNIKSTASLTNVTIFGNSATYGASGLDNGTYGGQGTTLKNTIIAGSLAGPNCKDVNAQTIISADGNLSDDDSCTTFFDKIHDLNGSANNPLLGPLALNGGTTQTHLPKAGSPAINGGISSGAPNTDQRGVTRPQGAAYDIGAVEVLPPATATPTRTATRTPTRTNTPTRTPTATTCAKPAKPVLIKPNNNGKVKTTAVPLDWNTATCATTYSVIVKQGAANGTKVFGKKNLALSQVTTNALTKGQIYYWQVTAVNSAGKTKSDWWSFKVK